MKTLIEIFDTIPKSVVSKDLGISLDRFDKMKDNVDRFSIRTLFKMAELIEVDELLILNLVYHQHQADKKSKKKPKS